MNRDPLFGFQGEPLKAYLERNMLAEKQTIMVYNGSAMTHEYSLAQVVMPEYGKQKRIVVRIMSTGEEVTFFRTGKSVIKKTRHYKLLPVVPWVVSRLGQQTRVRFNWKWGYA
jgi:hypothetical protein